MAKAATKPFLIRFSNEHSNFRLPELEALFKVFKFDPEILKSRTSVGPFVILNFPNEDLPKKLMTRSVLAHSCYELWVQGESLEEIHTKFKENISVLKPYNEARNTFQVRVENYGKKLSQAEKLERIETFDYIPLEGDVDLVNPELSIHLVQYFGQTPNSAPEEPYHLFLGRWVADGQRRLPGKIALKSRKFIGNTSMDPLLSLLMANLGALEENDVVCDPFVGTGSILVAAAVLGAYVCGADLDYLMLHGRTKPSRAFQKTRQEDENVLANMKQYNVESRYLDVLVADASKPIWRRDFRFDAIITDPPYGIREPTERIGTTQKDCKIKEEHLALHIPSKVEYALEEIYTDLILFAAHYLKLNGRLVCWIPISRPDYEPEKLPRHPCFNLVSNCEQSLTAWAARRLLIYEKVAEPTSQCETVIDGSALMYRVKFFELSGLRCRKERKATSMAQFGKGSGKRGPFLTTA